MTSTETPSQIHSSSTRRLAVALRQQLSSFRGPTGVHTNRGTQSIVLPLHPSTPPPGDPTPTDPSRVGSSEEGRRLSLGRAHKCSTTGVEERRVDQRVGKPMPLCFSHGGPRPTETGSYIMNPARPDDLSPVYWTVKLPCFQGSWTVGWSSNQTKTGVLVLYLDCKTKCYSCASG